PPVDGSYAWFCRDNPDIRVNACDPMIAVQRPSLSVIAGHNGIDRFPSARYLVKFLRRLRRVTNRRKTAGGSFEALRARLQTRASKIEAL
ncbi:hypothetical protein ACC848_39250, partial [Rhizobium johnstonii]